MEKEAEFEAKANFSDKSGKNIQPAKASEIRGIRLVNPLLERIQRYNRKSAGYFVR